MPYAFEGGVSQSPKQGAVEITELQYQSAIAAMLTGKVVTIEGGFNLVDKTPSEGGGETNTDPLTMAITKRQLRLTLVRNGISLAAVSAAIASMPDGLEKEEAQIEWEDASEFRRDHPTLNLIAAALGLTGEQVDEMWGQAVMA